METINVINVGGVDKEIEDTVARDSNTTQSSQIQTLTSNLATTNNNLTSEVSSRTSADALINARIDEIIAPSGEAPSAAEVADARIGDDGVTYGSLGTAIRTQVKNLKENCKYIFNKSSLLPSWSTIEIGYTINNSGVQIANDRRCLLECWKYDNAEYKLLEIAGDTYEFVVAIYRAFGESTFIRKLTDDFTTEPQLLPKEGNYYRVAFRRKDNAVITSDDVSAIKQVFIRYGLVDKSLTMNNVPSDSKTVGDSIRLAKDGLALIQGIEAYFFDDSNLTYGYAINNSGEIIEASVGRYTTEIMPISSDCFTIAYGARGTDVNIRTVGYDENGNFLRVVDLFTTGSNTYKATKTIAVGEDVAGIRVSYSVNADLYAVFNGNTIKKWQMNRRYSNMKSYGVQPPADGTEGSFCNTLTGTYAELISSVYEPLRTQYPNYISRKVIGRDASNLYDIYAYTFEPRYYQQSILLNAGIHAQEPDAIACLARLCQMIANATEEEPDLFYIRNNVKITVVPAVNVWGLSQNPHNNNNADGKPIQSFTTLPLIAEDQALVTLVESLKDELSFIVDMHTTTNDTYLDFYGVINRFSPNVRTLFRVNSWLCDNYAKGGRTVDDQYFGYRDSVHTFNAYCWNTYKIPCSTLELSDFHWGAKGSSDAITMGVTMWANYIIQQINDNYNHVDVIPFADYRLVKG